MENKKRTEWWIFYNYGIFKNEAKPASIKMGFRTYSEALNFAVKNNFGFFRIVGVELNIYEETEN